jgi:hypothetical protein
VARVSPLLLLLAAYHCGLDVGRYISLERSEFGIAGLERRCPGVSRDMIRHLLCDLKSAGRVERLGRVPGGQMEE